MMMHETRGRPLGQQIYGQPDLGRQLSPFSQKQISYKTVDGLQSPQAVRSLSPHPETLSRQFGTPLSHQGTVPLQLTSTPLRNGYTQGFSSGAINIQDNQKTLAPIQYQQQLQHQSSYSAFPSHNQQITSQQFVDTYPKQYSNPPLSQQFSNQPVLVARQQYQAPPQDVYSRNPVPVSTTTSNVTATFAPAATSNNSFVSIQAPQPQQTSTRLEPIYQQPPQQMFSQQNFPPQQQQTFQRGVVSPSITSQNLVYSQPPPQQAFSQPPPSSMYSQQLPYSQYQQQSSSQVYQQPLQHLTQLPPTPTSQIFQPQQQNYPQSHYHQPSAISSMPIPPPQQLSQYSNYQSPIPANIYPPDRQLSPFQARQFNPSSFEPYPQISPSPVVFSSDQINRQIPPQDSYSRPPRFYHSEHEYGQRQFEENKIYTEQARSRIEIPRDLDPLAAKAVEERYRGLPLERRGSFIGDSYPATQDRRLNRSYQNSISMGDRLPFEAFSQGPSQPHPIQQGPIQSQFVQTMPSSALYENNEHLKERDISLLFQKNQTDFLKDYLEAIVNMEREIEANRIKILKEDDYSVQLFYELFDPNSSGQIVIQELIQGLNILGINADLADAKLLIQRYSLNQNSSLDQQEFIQMVVPQTYKNIESIFVRKPYVTERNLKENTRQMMNKIMKGLLNAEVLLEQIRRVIDEQRIDLHQLFLQMSENSAEPVNKQNLKDYLLKIGIFANRDEIVNIMKRFDLKDMGFFREQEFIQELKPRLF